jgi:hypothetical protein
MLMNRCHLSAAAAAVAAAVAVGLGGCGGSTAGNPPAAHPSGSASTAPAAQPSATQPAQPSGTQVITYNPWASAGTLASGITASSTVSGYCWTGSGATDAPDAFRCTAGNIIYDPCFTYGSSSSSGECAYPNTSNPDSVVVVNLTPPPSTLGPAPTSTATSPPWVPWLLVLANGERCTPITGTGGPALDGKPQEDNCGTGGYNSVAGNIYGNPVESSATWTVSYAPLHAAGSAMTQVTVTEAYE